MGELHINWLTDVTIILYALSVLGYFIDFLQNNRKVNRLAFWLLSIVWFLQTVSIIYKYMMTERFPILTIFEGLLFYSWVLVTLSLLINRLSRIDFIVFFTNVLGFLMLALHLFMPTDQVPLVVQAQLMSELLSIHITMALIAYGAFTFAFVFSGMYLLQHQMLKQKKWTIRMKRFGNLSRLENLAYYSTMLGVPLLLLSIILGIIWAIAKLTIFVWTDPKVLTTFFIIGLYSFYLYMKVTEKKQGKSLAWINIMAFLCVLINLFLSTRLSNFHLWYQ